MLKTTGQQQGQTSPGPSARRTPQAKDQVPRTKETLQQKNPSMGSPSTALSMTPSVGTRAESAVPRGARQFLASTRSMEKVDSRPSESETRWRQRTATQHLPRDAGKQCKTTDYRLFQFDDEDLSQNFSSDLTSESYTTSSRASTLYNQSQSSCSTGWQWGVQAHEDDASNISSLEMWGATPQCSLHSENKTPTALGGNPSSPSSGGIVSPVFAPMSAVASPVPLRLSGTRSPKNPRRTPSNFANQNFHNHHTNPIPFDANESNIDHERTYNIGVGTPVLSSSLLREAIVELQSTVSSPAIRATTFAPPSRIGGASTPVGRRSRGFVPLSLLLGSAERRRSAPQRLQRRVALTKPTATNAPQRKQNNTNLAKGSRLTLLDPLWSDPLCDAKFISRVVSGHSHRTRMFTVGPTSTSIPNTTPQKKLFKEKKNSSSQSSCNNHSNDEPYLIYPRNSIDNPNQNSLSSNLNGSPDSNNQYNNNNGTNSNNNSKRESQECRREWVSGHRPLWADIPPTSSPDLCTIGELYLFGSSDSFLQNSHKAFRCFSRAIQQDPNHARAHYFLGLSHLEGRGTPVDAAKAFAAFSRAAELGLSLGQRMVGSCYERGEGVSCDMQAAKLWNCRAFPKLLKDVECKGGSCDREAELLLGVSCETGLGAPLDYEQAAQYYLKAAASGHSRAQYHLGRFFYHGFYYKQDLRKALHWFSKAALQGDPKAQTQLAACHLHGHGTTKDPARAVYWWSKAAAQGWADAELALGLCLLEDPAPSAQRQALHWLRQAAAHGSGRAINVLAMRFRDQSDD